MNKLLWLGMLLCVLGFSAWAEEEAPPPPLDPDYMGSHTMVLMSGGSNLFAANIPLYSKPSNIQLVYKLSNKDQALFLLVKDADLVTIKTKPFNIERLMRGQEVTVKADVYMGHIDKGGFLTFPDMELVFYKKMYLRELKKDNLDRSNPIQKYDSVKLTNGKRIMVHQIQTPPSYNHLVLLYQDVNCVTEFSTSSAVPRESEVLNRLSICGSMKPLFYSTDNLK